MVQTGLDCLLHDRLALVRNRWVGLITHPAAVLPDFTSTLDALQAAGAQVTALFGMEHGLAGAAAGRASRCTASTPRRAWYLCAALGYNPYYPPTQSRVFLPLVIVR